MFLLYEEDGHLKAGTILADNDASLQVEASTGKRSKIKAAQVLMRFAAPQPSAVLDEARRISAELDADFLWEVSGGAEFGFLDLARDYWGGAPDAAQAGAAWLKLADAPMYFYKRGRGRYQPATAETLAAAKAGMEKRRRQEEQKAAWVEELVAHRLPEALAPQVRTLLHRPDKNTFEWKAVEEAAKRAGLTTLRLFEKCGAIGDTHAYHLDAFLFEYFPRGTEFPAVSEPFDPPELPEASPLDDYVPVFSMDDEATTEIDDAFSVRWLDNGHARVGIHIAAPALGLARDGELDGIARDRLSTVYFPGHKLTMLPEVFIHHYTLGEAHACPALSMYVEADPDGAIVNVETRLEKVHVAANLRHESLEAQFNETTMGNPATPDYPYRRELEWLWGFSKRLEAARGKADQGPDRADYNFKLDGERVVIEPRKRGSPIDKVVSELMILANSRWGAWLAEAGVPALYRAQTSGKTRMTTAAEPHQGLGVACYAWSSSPLRRFIDLVNQRQLIALARGEAPAYAPRDPALFVILRDFELAYDAYNDFQRRMERYWCLRWLLQEGVETIDANLIRDDLARLAGLPLVVKAPSIPSGHAADTVVRLKLSAIDLLELTLHAEFVEVAGAPVIPAQAGIQEP
jgi:exoribonuclease-2